MQKINKFNQTTAMQIDSLVKSKTEKIYNLSAGDPNLDLQQSIIDAYKNLDLNSSHQYCSSQGLYELREKLFPDDPEQVIISNGAKQAIYMSLKAITEPKDEVVIIGPCWSSYIEICKLLDLNYKLLIGKASNRYIPSFSDLSSAINENTCAVLFNNPNNPTGAVYPEKFIDDLVGLSMKYKFWIISDEIYSDLLYKDDEFISLKGLNNVIYISGFSKSYSLTGWRFGYTIANEKIIQSMTAIQSQMSGPPSTLIQKILLDCIDNLKVTSEIYYARVKLLDNLSKWRPDGGFYFYLPISNYWDSSVECCEYFLNRYNIALTPGDDYGVPKTIRLSIANIDIEDLRSIKDYLTEIVDKQKAI